MNSWSNADVLRPAFITNQNLKSETVAYTSGLRIAFITSENLNSRNSVNNSVMDYHGWFKRRGHSPKIAGSYEGKLNLEGRIDEEDVIRAGNPASLIDLLRNYAVLHFNNPETPGFQPWFLTVLAFLPKRTVNFATFHGQKDYQNRKTGIMMPGTLAHKTFAERNIDRLFAVSGVAEEIAQKRLPGTYSLLPNPVDTERFKPGKRMEYFDEKKISDSNKFNLLFVGRNEPGKGLSYLAEAYFNLYNDPDYRDKVRLVIAGPGKIDDKSFSFLGKIPNENERNYAFCGDVSSLALPYFYRSADAAVFPSIDESGGMVLLEASASGTPVIASNIETYSAIADGNPGANHRDSQSRLKGLNSGLLKGKGIVLSRPADEKHLASAIKLLIDSPDLTERLKNEGLANSRNFSLETYGPRLEKTYYTHIDLMMRR